LNYEVLEALGQIAQEKNVNRDLVIETLEIGLLSAAKKRFGNSDNIDVNIDSATGTILILATKKVVEDDALEDSFLEMELSAAQLIDPKTRVGREIQEELPFADFGRNAIQSAKQILIQRVREAEREKIYEDYQGRIGEIVSGTVQQISHGDILINLGRTEAVVPLKEQIRKERYRQGDPIRAYLVNVLRTAKGPQVVLSRTHPGLLEKLFQFEVPEIYEGVIEVKAVSREPGERAKIAVSSNDARIDPVGACVGMKGSRVQAVVRELSNERIDIVPWSEDDAIFLSRALSPAVVKRVVVDRRDKRMTAIVDDDQLSLAIGKSGQNARLAAQLTGWKVDIITETRYQELQAERAATHVPMSEVPGVGKVMQERLEEASIVSANDLAESTMDRLLEVQGVGEATAEKVQEAAKAIVEVKVSAYREELRIEREAEEAKAAEEAAVAAAAAAAAEAAAEAEALAQAEASEAPSEDASEEAEDGPEPPATEEATPDAEPSSEPETPTPADADGATDSSPDSSDETVDEQTEKSAEPDAQPEGEEADADAATDSAPGSSDETVDEQTKNSAEPDAQPEGEEAEANADDVSTAEEPEERGESAIGDANS
jgi:transcription termination/antitermination protein NusA